MSTTTKNPTHNLFHITKKKGGEKVWTPIAAGWVNVDGSINISARGGAILIPGESYQLRERDESAPAGNDN